LRPSRLLPRPEPVEALALLPDHPPASFRWRHLAHRVVAGEGPERIVGEWWRAGPADKSPADKARDPEASDDETAAAELPPLAARDYFRVEDEEGRRYWLFRSAGRWFLHGLFA
ncbi:MAG: DNA polymerase Y family protein, partial [Geminicoccales bacterium]